jgi:signal transduction histidine kinase
MRHALLFVLLALCHHSQAQNEVAEWRKKIATATNDKEQTALLMHLGFYYASEMPDSAATIYHRAALVARKSGDAVAYARASLAEAEVLLAKGFTIQSGRIIERMDTALLDGAELIRWHRSSAMLHALKGDVLQHNFHRVKTLNLATDHEISQQWLYDVLELGLFTTDSMQRQQIMQCVEKRLEQNVRSAASASILKSVMWALRSDADTLNALLDQSTAFWKTDNDSLSLTTCYFLRLRNQGAMKKVKSAPLWIDSVLTWMPAASNASFYPLMALHFTSKRNINEASRWFIKTDSLMVEPAEQLQWLYLKSDMQGVLGLTEARQATLDSLDVIRTKLWLLESSRLMEEVDLLEKKFITEVKTVKQEAEKSTDKYKGWLYGAAAGALLLLGAAVWLTVQGLSRRRKWALEKSVLEQEVSALKSTLEDSENNTTRKELDIRKKESETTKLRTLVEQQEMELRRVGVEVSTQVGSAISTARQHLDALRQSGKELSVEHFMHLQNALTKANKELKAVSDLLVPDSLEQKGLPEALRLLGEKQSRQGLQITVSPSGKPFLMDHIQEIALYRIGAEIIVNAVRHSEASRLNIQLNYLDRELVMIASDNGRGFDVNAAVSLGKGIKGIVSRVTLLKGDIDVASSASKGTEYTISVKTHKV